MRISAKIIDTFSPYMDPHPVADFYDNFAKRGASALGLAVTLNAALFFTLASHTALPALKPREPNIIPVQIITPPKPEPEGVPETSPVIPPVIPAPLPDTPPPSEQPIAAPESVPEPVIEARPAVIVSPPQVQPQLDRDALKQRALEALQSRLEAQTPPPEIIPEIISEPIPAPIDITPLPKIEIYEPIPQTVPEPVLEPIIIEPIEQPLPEIERFNPEPLPEVIIEIYEPEPFYEPVSEPEQIIPDAAPGIIIDQPILYESQPLTIYEPIAEQEPEPEFVAQPLPVPEILPEIVPEVVPDIIPEPITPEPIVITPSLPEITPDIIDTAPIVTAAPRILADDDAPESEVEQQRAVTQEQAVTSVPAPSAYQTPRLSGGGGAPALPRSASPPPSVASRPSLGSKGWNLDPSTVTAEPATGGTIGIVLDMRCREAGRTHEDCPEYIKKITGRAADGSQSLGTQRNSQIGGTSLVTPGGSGSARAGANRYNPAIGGGAGASSARGGGWASQSTGLPSTSVIDDADFGRTFRNVPLNGGGASAEGARLRDLISGQQALPEITLEPSEEVSEVKDKWSLEELP